jgi:hypothetical protein
LVKQEKEKISQDRAMALDWSFKATRLLDDKYYNRIKLAIENKVSGEDEFRSICEEAGLPNGLIDLLYSMLNAVSPGSWWM